MRGKKQRIWASLADGHWKARPSLGKRLDVLCRPERLTTLGCRGFEYTETAVLPHKMHTNSLDPSESHW